MSTLLHDVRTSLRGLSKNPGFAFGVILILALGIGANSTAFSLVNAFLLRPLPFDHPDRLVHVWATNANWDSNQDRMSVPDFLDFRDQSTALEDLGGYYYGSDTVTGLGDPMRIQTTNVTGSLLGLLGVDPVMGRGFTEDDARSGHEKIVLLNHRFWKRHFQGDPNIVGRTVPLDGEGYTIVGVMPESFEFPLKATMMWKPLPLDSPDVERKPGGPLLVVGRLKDGATIEQAQADLATIGKRLEGMYPDSNAGVSVNVVPLREAMVFFYDMLKLMFLTLLLATGFVTLIVCANVGNLLLARSTGRAQEVAIRAALGAGRWRIVRHLFMESLCLAIAGGAVGAGLSFLAVKFIGPLIPEDLYRAGTIGVDGSVLAFILIVSMGVAVLFGLAPALTASRADLNRALRAGGRGASGHVRSQRMHGMLVVSEIALAMCLVVSAMLMVRSFMNMQDVKPGFNPDNVLTAEMILPDKFYESRESWNNFYDDALARIRARPEVISAAAVYPLPMNFESFSQSFVVDGQPYAGPEDEQSAGKFWVTPDFFTTMELPVLMGRTFSEFDDADSDPVVVINDIMAQRYWPGDDPLGRRLRLYPGQDNERQATVVGVVGDMKSFLMTDDPSSLIFVPQAQMTRNRRFFLVRSQGDPMQQVAMLRSEIGAIDPSLPLTEVRSMRQVVDQSMGIWGGAATAFGSLGIGALILAAIGLYSLIAYSVGRRIQELGIRIALGAQKLDIITLVMRRGLWLTGIGVAIGLAGAIFLSRLLGALLFDIGANDPATFALTAGILIMVALLASYLPTRRAIRVDPMKALRSE